MSRTSRPVFRSSRRVALVAAVVVSLGASACGSDATPDDLAGASASTDAASLPKIMIGGSGVNGEAQSASRADLAMTSRPAMLTEYRWVGDPVDLTSPAAAWRFPAGLTVADEVVAQLAAAFGVEGDVRALPADQGGGRIVGPDDWSGPTVLMFEDTLGSWSYQNPLPMGSPAVACATPGYDPSISETGEAMADQDGATAAESAPVDTARVETEVPAVECAEPQPPANVPTEVEAEQMARELFQAIGVDLEAATLEVYADEWGASVTTWTLIGGVRSSLASSVGFGAEGEITWASGFFATPERVADYPRIGLEAAIARLNEQSSGWWSPSPIAVDAAGASSDAVSSEAVVAPDTVVDGVVDTVVGSVVDTIVEPVPEMLPEIVAEPETMIVDLVAVAPQLEMVWDTDGSVWLVPAYSFTTAEGWTVTAFALGDEYLVQPEVEPMPEPMPEPLPAPDASPATIDEVAAVVVGLAEEEAIAVAESNGWILRVARLDGEELALTADYVANRFDVEVTAGQVTAVLSNG